MDKAKLEGIAQKIMTPGRGILAADESTGTIKKRFDSIGTESTENKRRDYREMLFRTAGFGDNISGVILFDETLRQNAKDGTPLRDLITAADAVPGIKVDTGAKPLPNREGEMVTEGLDGLRERFAEYADLGAGFAKWRAVINIGNGIPSYNCLKSNM
ncbi:MAG: class I fructose-bisphosphate aldolase, partial [Alphaproteobacteria bacterium]